VEVLGNHTDYNEGFVLSAAIDLGTFFLAAPAPDGACRVLAADVDEEAVFQVRTPGTSAEHPWSNYVRGVLAGLAQRAQPSCGFLGMLLGNIPLGAGLSSSAALEMSAGLALAALYGIPLAPPDLARIGQAAEHAYAGVKCGLLDQITSLFGRENALVQTDFRSLDVVNVPFGSDACFLMCDTHAKHRLVDSEYNLRRSQCEAAVAFFADRLPRPVRALRDVTRADWDRHASGLDPVTAHRALHIIGENERVRHGAERLKAGDLAGFGRLMFRSHESSRRYFENSCPELDFLVEQAARMPGVLGARLSGGGFGGSAVVLLHPRDVDHARAALASAYRSEFGRACDVRPILPSAGATLVDPLPGDVTTE